ncbi:hypothetical protein NL108_012129 [Boleophthalmus pectinirostris]|nr:hypothetical protein NL108_012129 [Boleophthalmus pectinirostris]
MRLFAGKKKAFGHCSAFNQLLLFCRDVCNAPEHSVVSKKLPAQQQTKQRVEILGDLGNRCQHRKSVFVYIHLDALVTVVLFHKRDTDRRHEFDVMTSQLTADWSVHGLELL